MAIAIGIAAVATSAIGTGISVMASQQGANAQKDIAQQQQQANQISLKQMEVDAQRRQLQTIRQGQIAKAQSTATATSQNAQLGSGLQGGLAQISGEQNYNLLGIGQNLDLGKEMANVNQQISYDRMSLASAQGLNAWGQGLSSLGNSVIGAYGTINRVSQGFGSNSMNAAKSAYSNYGY